MSEFLSFLESVFYIVVLFALQFFLVARKNKYWGLILPGIMFVCSIVCARKAFSIEPFFVNTVVTALIVFLMVNVDTVLLLIIYYYRRAGNSIGSVLIAVFLVWAVIACVVGFAQTVWMVSYIQENDPKPNIGSWYYAPSERISVENLPVSLEDLGIDTLPYRYKKVFIRDNFINDQGTYIDSLADDVERPAQVVTLSYEIWLNNHSSALDRKENQLQKKYGEPITAQYEYGSNSAYWMQDCLLLRYDNCILLFDADSTKELLDSKKCAQFFRNKFVLEEL